MHQEQGKCHDFIKRLSWTNVCIFKLDAVGYIHLGNVGENCGAYLNYETMLSKSLIVIFK